MLKVVAVAFVVAASTPAQAHSGGMTGRSGASSGLCSDCHGSTSVQSIQLTGPSTVAVGQKVTYTLTVVTTSTALVVGGLDVAASGGTLSVNANEPSTQRSNGEITHSSPKAAGLSESWLVDWTAPASAGSVTLYAASIRANGTGTPLGDQTGNTSFAVQVTPSADAGADATAADSTADTTAPDSTVDTTAPDSTVDTTAPDTTADTRAPDTTADTGAPDGGADGPAPDTAGGDVAAPDASAADGAHDVSTTDARALDDVSRADTRSSRDVVVGGGGGGCSVSQPTTTAPRSTAPVLLLLLLGCLVGRRRRRRRRRRA